MTLTLRLTSSKLQRSRSIAHIVRANFKRAPKRLVASFEFKTNERAFAIELLSRKPNYWIYRTHQGALCGDFLVVDMAAAQVNAREVSVVDLKMNAPLRIKGGAGNQFVNAERAVKDLVRNRVCSERFTCFSGSKLALLESLGATQK